MTHTTALAGYEPAPPRRLNPYEGGLSAEGPRVDALAVISCGYRGKSEGNRPGLPRASRPGDEQQIHLHDSEGRAPGLAAALEAGGYRQLQIAFPLNDGFIIQRFTRYSATRLELYGDESAITEIIPGDPPRHKRWDAGTPEYERLVKTCKADTRIYFCLAEWTPTGPQVVFPDGLGTYAIRTTSQHSVRSIMGTLAYTSKFTRGGIAGLPFLLSVDHREVAGPDGTKRNIPVWTITTKPPEGARLSSRTFRALATSALREGAQLMLAAPDERTWEDMESDGPLVDEPSEAEIVQLAAGGLCDYDFWVKSWHARARGTAWDSDEARASFIGGFTGGATESLSDYLHGASEERAGALIVALGEAIANSQRQSHVSAYDKAFGTDDDWDKAADTPTTPGLPVAPADGKTTPSEETVSKAPAVDVGVRQETAPERQAASPPPEPRPAEEPMVTSVKSRIYQRYAELVEKAAALEIEYVAHSLPVSVAELTRLGAALSKAIADKQAEPF